MINPFEDINWKPTDNDVRKFGRTLLIGGVIIAVVLSVVGVFYQDMPNILRILAKVFGGVAVAGVIAMLLPKPARPLYFVWFFIGGCIGTVVSNVVFILFYYVLFTGVALSMRLIGRDALMLRARDRDSMWMDHRQPSSLSQYYRQY
jgi:hypothetical protein